MVDISVFYCSIGPWLKITAGKSGFIYRYKNFEKGLVSLTTRCLVLILYRSLTRVLRTYGKSINDISRYKHLNVIHGYRSLLGKLVAFFQGVACISMHSAQRNLNFEYFYREVGILKLKWRNRPDLVDKVSRVAFPAAYAFFFIVHFAI